MKKLILLMILIGLASINVFSQKKVISQDEYFFAYRRALDLSNNAPRRINTEITQYEGDKVIKTTTKINEIIDENTQRFILVENENGKTVKTEWVKLNSKIFTRQNNNKWQKNKDWNDGSVDGGGTPNPEYTSEKVKINNEEVTILQSFSKYYVGNEKVQRFISDTIYVKANGYILKTEMLFGQFEPRVVKTKETATYVFNPKDLKIKAPKIP
jgi:hypothetical protein